MATLHRWLNTSLTTICGAALLAASIFGYNKYQELDLRDTYKTEMNQLISDEGFEPCPYKDSLGYRTIGFGHLIKPGENFDDCITLPEAFNLFYQDYSDAVKSVEDRYEWADGETKLVLVNMTFQLGETGLSKFKKTLHHLEEEEYVQASMEMLDSRWARQTPMRAVRLSTRIIIQE